MKRIEVLSAKDWGSVTQALEDAAIKSVGQAVASLNMSVCNPVVQKAPHGPQVEQFCLTAMRVAYAAKDAAHACRTRHECSLASEEIARQAGGRVGETARRGRDRWLAIEGRCEAMARLCSLYSRGVRLAPSQIQGELEPPTKEDARVLAGAWGVHRGEGA